VMRAQSFLHRSAVRHARSGPGIKRPSLRRARRAELQIRHIRCPLAASPSQQTAEPIAVSTAWYRMLQQR
jgi:hypothetical protein